MRAKSLSSYLTNKKTKGISQNLKKAPMNSRKLEGERQQALRDDGNLGGIGFALIKEKKDSHLRVEVRFYGFVRDIIGSPAASIALEMPTCSTLRELVNLLAQKFGEKFSERILTIAGELEPNVRFFVGDAQVLSLEEPLGDGENSFAEVKVFVLSATAGG